MKKEQVRYRVGVILDYSLRIPNFLECYSQMRQQISVGVAQMSGGMLDQEDIVEENRSVWDSMRDKDPKAAEFYETLSLPKDQAAPDFDITYRKYFYTPEHRIQFLTDWTFNLFGTGSVTNKMDVNMLNIAQSKLFDVVIIDRCTHTRKIGNTFAFLSRAGLFCKEVLFVSTEEEIKKFGEQPDVLGVWDPFANPEHKITNVSVSTATDALIAWLIQIENSIKK